MTESNWDEIIPGSAGLFPAFISADPHALVIATITDEIYVDSTFNGWREAMDRGAGVGWILDRIDGATPDPIGDG
jgi:hypothetical protein